MQMSYPSNQLVRKTTVPVPTLTFNQFGSPTIGYEELTLVEEELIPTTQPDLSDLFPTQPDFYNSRD